MGTDIHPIVQVRKAEGEPWEIIDIPRADDYGNYLDSRNYNLFAVLGDVRNGTGFAGIRTSAGFIPISSDRGLPEDVGFEMEEYGNVYCPRHDPNRPKAIEPTNRAIEAPPTPVTDVVPFVADADEDDDLDDPDSHYDCSECFWLGEHSHGWVSLRELQDYDWAGQKTALVGVIPLKLEGPNTFLHEVDYEEWSKTEGFLDAMPPSYSGAVSGRDVITIDEPQVRDLAPEPGKTYYVRLARAVDVRYAVGEEFTDVVIPWLATLGEPDNVRIVFGFDS